MMVKSLLEYSGKFIFLVVAYYAASAAGIMLQVPPGQASIVWPAAGLAMGAVYVFGYKYIPAVFFGALLSSLQFYDVIDLQSLTIANLIAFGASLQAGFGAFAIKKFVNPSSALETVLDISKIMFFGGPVACCISASIATSVLVLYGIIAPEDTISHIYSWWIGDVFGVLVFTPVVILLFSGKDSENLVSLKRKLFVTLPVLMAFVIFAALFLIAKSDFENRAYQEFKMKTSALVNDFKEDLAIDFSALIAVKSFFNASEYVSAEEFEIFTYRILMNAKGMYGMSWLPKVKREGRNDFERAIREQGFPGFVIKSRMGEGELIVSKEREVYFPLAYTQPFDSNKRAHGFDVYGVDAVSGNVRRAILDNARDTGEKRATGRFPIVQREEQYGFIIYEPVYKNHEGYNSLQKRREAHLGYINGIFVFPELMRSMNLQAKDVNMDVILRDVSSVQDPQVLFDSRTKDFKTCEQQHYDFSSIVHSIEKIDVAGRSWEAVFLKNTPLLSASYMTELWFFVTGGVLFNSLLGLLLMLITARTEIVENLVDERTHDLQQANAELEEFAYRTSHDLRSPLASSIGLLGVIEEHIIADKDKNKILKSVALVNVSLMKLEALIMDILALTQTKNKQEELSVVDIQGFVEEALKKFRHMENFDRLEINTDFEFKGELVALPDRVQLIVENLISNAIKYQDTAKEESYVNISTNQSANNVVFVVEDNGLGIPENRQEKLFEMFHRFHPKVSFGSGLGLYMMKKSADILGADILFEDTRDGSRFKLVIPLRH